jgi:hypothetical protein
VRLSYGSGKGKMHLLVIKVMTRTALRKIYAKKKATARCRGF